jgi:hypothetical protein
VYLAPTWQANCGALWKLLPVTRKLAELICYQQPFKVNRSNQPDNPYGIKLTEAENSHEKMRHVLGMGRGKLVQSSVSFLLAFFESEIAIHKRKKRVDKKT